MKKALYIVKSYFETGDVPTQQQFEDTWDSFHHKDDGFLVTDKTIHPNGDVTFTFSDGSNLTIDKFIEDATKPIEYIDGLLAQLTSINNALTNKVDKEAGKGLSDTNYSQVEKDKLAGLENYVPPVSKPISFIDGLQDLLNQIQQDITLKVDKVDGKGLSSNDYTDQEKADLSLNTSARVSNAERIKWNNHLSEWVQNEVLKTEMDMIIRVWNGSIWKFIGDFTNGEFITTDVETEISQDKWMEVISTFPAVEFATINPKSIAPNTQKWFQIDGSNIKNGTTLHPNKNITVLNYIYESANRMLVELQSTVTEENDIEIDIDNGKRTRLISDFAVTQGEVLIPGVVGSEWLNTHSQLIYTIGGWEAQVTGSKYVGRFGEIPTASDFEFKFRINSNVIDPNMYFGFKTDPNDFTVNSNAALFIRAGVDAGTYYIRHGNTTPIHTDIADQLITAKRIMQGASTCIVEFYRGLELVYTTPIINVNGSWYPYFYTYTNGKMTEIELKIV
ncbi:hypothetical protein [Pseudotenacibaculum haliotis]|uniref:Uncharacterized protein n=1 Tax=Pseudotenacibaculum haliotis TaxID=1862138 RepID=A0ABW5LQA9_9FLAO